MPLSDIHLYDPQSLVQQTMIIDAQAAKHLELLEVESFTGGITQLNSEVQQVTRRQTGAGSVFEWMDHTKTGFGKRMLKKWLASPLY